MTAFCQFVEQGARGPQLTALAGARAGNAGRAGRPRFHRPRCQRRGGQVARLLWEGRGCAGAEFCFISLAEPSVPATLDKVHRLGADRVVVAPYFLFPGVLPERVAAQSHQFAALHSGLDMPGPLRAHLDPLHRGNHPEHAAGRDHRVELDGSR